MRRIQGFKQTKLDEAECVIAQYDNYIGSIERKSIGEDELLIFEKYCTDIKKLFDEITELCRIPGGSSSFSTMDKFDLKVALSLLPVMNDTLSNLRQLIDGIEYYSSVLNTESQMYLTSFVLKGRLSQSAKLKLATKYDTVPDLLNDMKRLLLPKKSTNALQKQFFNCRQNDESINVFVKTLSELFVDLTISQSEGNDEKFKILKSINEKQAIRQFSDGLRNRRIGTIITAQKFENLKDAIQAAIDEDISGSSSTAEVFTLTRHNNNRFFKTTSRPPSHQSIPKGTYNTDRWRGNPSYNGRQSHTRTRQWAQQPQSQPRGAPRGRAPYRGRTFNNYSRGHRPFRRQIRTVVTNESQPQSSSSAQNSEPENDFFRAFNI
ncbi:hypothetical protein KGM_213884 [Danaus plexippus plexippus]|uniref:Uncharacterized protein n=1 Tax=Danaus plexippus plexippus TaxID=278856 RepID=A0A212F529_DANPL|nr:hypothetical protein KGM_213884 [Danaus plexippus plexippus]